jgi:hypothetical protein
MLHAPREGFYVAKLRLWTYFTQAPTNRVLALEVKDAAMAARSSSESNEPGILGRLPHSDLLTFLCLAQKFHTNLLEYSPRYNDHDARVGGNAIVQIVHLSTDVDAVESLPSFAFKRHDLVGGLGPEDRLKKIICELIIYENPTIACHPNIADLRGISWSVDATRPGSLSRPTVSPVLGFHPSKGNLADVLAITNINLVKKLEICRDIGHALETLHSLSMSLITTPIVINEFIALALWSAVCGANTHMVQDFLD